MLKPANTFFFLHCAALVEVGLLPIGLLVQPDSEEEGNAFISFSLISHSHIIHQAASAHNIHSHTQTDAEIKNKAPCHFPPKITSQFCCLFSIDHSHFATNSHFSKLLSSPTSSPSSPPFLGWKQELQMKTEQNWSCSSAFTLIVISNTCSSLRRLCNTLRTKDGNERRWFYSRLPSRTSKLVQYLKRA